MKLWMRMELKMFCYPYHLYTLDIWIIFILLNIYVIFHLSTISSILTFSFFFLCGSEALSKHSIANVPEYQNIMEKNWKFWSFCWTRVVLAVNLILRNTRNCCFVPSPIFNILWFEHRHEAFSYIEISVKNNFWIIKK